MDSKRRVTKRKVMNPASDGTTAKAFVSENPSGWRRCGSRLQRKVTSPASSDGTCTKTCATRNPSGWTRLGKRLQRNVTSPASNTIDVTAPVSNTTAAKTFGSENPSGWRRCSQWLQRNVTVPASDAKDATGLASVTTEVSTLASNGRGPENPCSLTEKSSGWKRSSPRLQKIPLSQRPFYGSCRRVPEDIKFRNCKENSGFISNSGTTTLHTDSSANDSGAHGLNADLVASNNIMVQTSGFSHALESSASTAAKETMTTFHRLYLQLIQEEQTMHKKVEGSLPKDADDRNLKVIECWALNRVSGFLGYKYQLRQLEEQPKLTINQMMKIPLSSPGVVCMDISAGQEEICIPAINMIDDVLFATSGFTYSKSIQVAENVEVPPNADGCNCKGNCVNPKTCACARLNGSKFPYVRHTGGRLTRAKNVVFECGPMCGCGPDCINRLSQQGIKYGLEVFRTQDKGWAVRTRDFIPSGAPVCEYTGVLKRTKDLDNVDDNDYIFEIDCLHTIKGVEGRERRCGAVSGPLRNHLEQMEEGYFYGTPEFCIDANSVGNVARFINHSCEPNLFVQCILSAHHDARLARIVLFASENIASLQELTYDYGCPLDSVVGSDGKVRKLACHCGTAECRKRVY